MADCGAYNCNFRICRRDCIAYDLLGSDRAYCDRYKGQEPYNNCIETKTRCENMYKNDPKND